MQITGLIYNIDLDNRIFSIKQNKRLLYFYLSNGLMRKFKKYLFEGILVSFVYEEEAIIKHNI